MRTFLIAGVVFGFLAGPAAAQTTPPAPPGANHRALAAGYKALTLCSALFTARDAGGTRTQASVEAHEFVGIYPELQPLIAGLPVQTSEAGIAVTWDEAAPPRVAQFTPGRGCTLMPTGFVGGMREMKPVTRRTSAPPLPTGVANGDAAALEAAVGRGFAGDFGPGSVTTGVVILQDGRVVAERYAPDFGPDIPRPFGTLAAFGVVFSIARRNSR